jgi:RNA polymerase sigma-70 factor (ECF subfamily)
LIARSLHGDHAAYGELVERYKNAIYHHCFAMVRSEAVAEDLAQDTFIAAYYKLALYKSEYRFSTWLFKIATNKTLDYLKRAAREIAADDVLIASIASTRATPPREAEHAELRRAVHNLRPNYRAVISLFYWQGLTYEEIALVLAAPVGSVKAWMNRAKRQLQQELS